MNAYYIESGWRTGIVAAISSLHALEVAVDTGLHKVGNTVSCHRVELSSLTKEIADIVRMGPGRVIAPSLFRMSALLIKPNSL